MHRLFKKMSKRCKKDPMHSQCTFFLFFTILGAGAVFSWLLFLLPGILLFVGIVIVLLAIGNRLE